MNKVYILIFEMYNEWAIENGACEFIGVYENLDMLYKDLDFYIESEKEQDLIIEDSRENNLVYVYINQYDYNCGINSGAYRIIESEVK